MKKLFTIAFAVILMIAFAVTVSANPDNQIFTGTPVEVVAPDEAVILGEEATITITVENPSDLFRRGIPQVEILVNGVPVAFVTELARGAFLEYVIEVDTTEVGVQEFTVEVWTRRGNKNWEEQLWNEKYTVEVIDPSTTLAEDLNEFIGNGRTNLVGYLSRVNGEVLLTFGDTVISLGNWNNLNIRGSVVLPDGSGTLHFDIRGNGSNVVLFEVRK